jgi:hypothetical protein
VGDDVINIGCQGDTTLGFTVTAQGMSRDVIIPKCTPVCPIPALARRSAPLIQFCFAFLI